MEKKALVVDDNGVIRGNIREILESSNFEVYEACDGIESIDMYEELKPTIVIMDINMPRLNGLEATAKIMQNHPDANIAICSSMLFIPYYQKLALKSGAKALISKPFTRLELISGLNELLEKMR
ncbi:response regulator [Streptobacillus felis]|uniref:Response regulator n=1 Tax=Streptobacillus felis TaxID=1384509 RepID=A0A7Z0PFF3_9FUSO|nr:response regulator [Streptobacillus felis]NYV27753.1 response regulator [Streptobacillus felis]